MTPTELATKIMGIQESQGKALNELLTLYEDDIPEHIALMLAKAHYDLVIELWDCLAYAVTMMRDEAGGKEDDAAPKIEARNSGCAPQTPPEGHREAREALERFVEGEPHGEGNMTPNEMTAKMREIAKYNDTEDGHLKADRLMATVLRALGYGDAVDVCHAMRKWYA